MDGNAEGCAEVCFPVEKLWTVSNAACYSGDSVWLVWKSFPMEVAEMQCSTWSIVLQAATP
jgi:hypothetical protein